jgi:hypothetical protein
MSYCPLALNNILGLDENTIDKTFEIPMLKSINLDIKRTKPTTKSENWNELRRDIRNYVLDNWQDIAEVYKTINAKFSGREYDVVEGVLTIARLVGEDVYAELEKYVGEKMDEQQVDLENNSSYKIFSLIWKQFEENPLMQENKVFYGDLAEQLFNAFNPNLEYGTIDYSNQKKGFSKYLAKIIKSVPMFRKTGLINGRTYVIIKRKDLNQYMKLQHFTKDDDALPTPTTSTTSTTSPTSTKKVEVGEQSNQNIRKKGEVGEQVEVGEEKKEVEEFVKSKIEVVKI